MLFHWFQDHYIETAGAFTGLLYLYFSVRQIKWLWPLGIVTSFFYIFVFYEAKFYADMGLQVYYFWISIYGWFHWSRKSDVKEGIILPVKRYSSSSLGLSVLVTFVLTILMGFILVKYTDSPIPWWDGFTTAASMTATWMLARKILENWIYWIVIDIISAILYYEKGLYPTVLLFAFYSLIAIIGYFKWRKTMLKD